LIHSFFSLAADTVTQVFDYYGIKVGDAFDVTLDAMNEAAEESAQSHS